VDQRWGRYSCQSSTRIKLCAIAHMSESFFGKFRKKETVVAAGPSPIWYGVPDQTTQTSSPTSSLPVTQPAHQAPTPVTANDFTFQPRPQPLSSAVPATTPTISTTDTPTSNPNVVYPRAVSNNQPPQLGVSAAGITAATTTPPHTFGPYAGGRHKDNDHESGMGGVFSGMVSLFVF
jgi:hypothetical protein